MITRNHGVQRVRWTGASRFAAKGSCAPVRFETGALGNTAPLMVSQQHRVLLEGWQAELLFGEETVLVPAVHLLNDTTVRLRRGGVVRYHHLLLEEHAVIRTNGAWTESFHLGAKGLRAIDEGARAELLRLCPEGAQANCCGYPVLKRHEGAMMNL